MRYEELLSFYITVKEGSFTAAAKKLYKTQPAISMAIKQLEIEYGQPLLRRKTGGGFDLTPLGEQVHQVVQEIINKMERLETIKQECLRQIKNEIIIECDTVAGSYLISPLTNIFQNQTGINISIKNTETAIQSILNGKCDLALLLFPDQLQPNYNLNLEVIFSWEDQHEIIVPNDHSLAGKFLLTNFLSKLTFISAPKSSPYRCVLDETLKKQLGNNANCIVELNSIEIFKESVLSLNKPGIVLRSAVKRELKNNTFSIISTDLNMRCQHLLVFRKHNAHSNAILKLSKYLKNLTQLS